MNDSRTPRATLVAVFADRAALRPFTVLFIPARLGLWQRYQRDR